MQKNQHEITRRRFMQLSSAAGLASVLAFPLYAAPSPLLLEAGEIPLPQTPINTESGTEFILSELREFARRVFMNYPS